MGETVRHVKYGGWLRDTSTSGQFRERKKREKIPVGAHQVLQTKHLRLTGISVVQTTLSWCTDNGWPYGAAMPA